MRYSIIFRKQAIPLAHFQTKRSDRNSINRLSNFHIEYGIIWDEINVYDFQLYEKMGSAMKKIVLQWLSKKKISTASFWAIHSSTSNICYCSAFHVLFSLARRTNAFHRHKRKTKKLLAGTHHLLFVLCFVSFVFAVSSKVVKHNDSHTAATTHIERKHTYILSTNKTNEQNKKRNTFNSHE